MAETTKFWQRKAWKERRKEILSVRNKCEWCNLTQEESLRKYKTGLSIHHIERPTGLQLWSRVALELYEQSREDTGSGKKGEKYPEFREKHKPQIDEEYRRLKEDSLRRYAELRDDEIQVLCLRCHAAKEKRYRLCPKCKKHYMRLVYGTCYECSKDKIEQRR